MTLLYCCPDAECEGEGAEHSPTCPERRAAEIAAESDTLFDLPDQPRGGAHL